MPTPATAHLYSPHLAHVVGALNAEGARQAIRYVDHDFVVKATAMQPRRPRDRNRSVMLTYGKPNYAERAFIKDAIAAGEPFPVKKVQFRWWPNSSESKALKVARKVNAGKKVTAREVRTLAASSLRG